MALENGGLDAQIEQRMDAYRGNPQQLQQRYGQNKELLDLLALQKLTSEKQAASRDMQMKMQQQPGTIAQQREQEALELTKQEMGSTLGDLAGRTKSTLDQKQMTQQQNMGKMAQAASRPPQGGIGALMGGGAQPQARPAAPPQAQGLAAARMAQGPSKFAGGGIVSFAQGQGVRGNRTPNVTQEEIEQYRATVGRTQRGGVLNDAQITRRILASRERAAGQERANFRDVAQQNIDMLGAGEQRKMARTGRAPGDMGDRLGIDIGTPLEVPAAGIGALLAPATAAPDPNTVSAPEGINPDLLDPRGPHQIPPVASAPAPNQTTEAVPTAGETAASFQATQTAGAANTGVMGAQGTTNADSAFLKGTRMADEYTGRAAASESYEGMKSRLSEFDEANYGPNDDLNAFLIGMGGTGSIGSAMKGGYNAMNRSKNNRRNRLMDEFQLEKDRIGADAVFSTAGIRLGTQLAADAAANERNIRSAMATMGAAKIRAATADANRLVDVYKAELKAVDDATARAIQVTTNERLGDQTRLTAAIKVQSDVAKTRASLLEDQLSKSLTLQRFQMQKSKASDDPKALAEINKNIAAETAQIALIVESVLNTPTPSGINLIELESTAATTIRKLMGIGGISEDDVTGVTVDGE